jgi:hypothetical protein
VAELRVGRYPDETEWIGSRLVGIEGWLDRGGTRDTPVNPAAYNQNRRAGTQRRCTPDPMRVTRHT